jgi:hypothetical protein
MTDAWVELDKDAEGPYRYMLWRGESKSGMRMTIIQLNPSEAGASERAGKTDPTVRIVERWAVENGYASVMYLNLFAWRHGKSAALDCCITEKGADYAIGPRNDDVLSRWTTEPDVYAAWGDAKDVRPNAGAVMKRRVSVLALLDCDLWRVGPLTKRGNPMHGYSWGFRMICDRQRRLWRRSGAFVVD